MSRYFTTYNPKYIFERIKKGITDDEIRNDKKAISRTISSKMFQNLKERLLTGKIDKKKSGTWGEIQSETSNKIDLKEFRNEQEERSKSAIIIDSSELAIQKTPEKKLFRRNFITTQDLAIILKTKYQNINEGYKRIKQQLRNHTWTEIINSRKQRVFDEYAVKIICSELRIPITKDLREYIKQNVVPGAITGKYVETEKIVEIFKNKIENLEIQNKNFGTRIEKLEDKTINIETKFDILDLDNKLMRLSIEYNKWAQRNNYARGTYSVFWGQSEAIKAKELLFNAFLKHPECFRQSLVSVSKNSFLKCAVSGKEIKYYEDFIAHHAIKDKFHKHIDYNNLFTYDTGIHTIFPIHLEVHNKYHNKIKYVEDLLKFKVRFQT